MTGDAWPRRVRLRDVGPAVRPVPVVRLLPLYAVLVVAAVVVRSAGPG